MRQKGDFMLVDNITVGRRLVQLFGGYIRLIGSSVIYYAPDGKVYLVRFTTGSSVTISRPLYGGALDGVWFCFADHWAGCILFQPQLKSVSHRHTHCVI